MNDKAAWHFYCQHKKNRLPQMRQAVTVFRPDWSLSCSWGAGR